MKKYFEKLSINIAIIIVFFLILVGATLSFYNKQVMRRALVVKEQSDMVMRLTENTFLTIKDMDVSSRGYAIMQEESYLFYAVERARETNRRTFSRLDSLFAIQGYSDPVNYSKLQKNFAEYTDLYEEMVHLLRQGKMDEYKALLAQDYGKEIWKVNEAFSEKLYAFEEALYKEAQANYDAAVFRNTLIYVLLLLIGLPTLGMVLFTLKKEAKKRALLILNLKKNNEKYLFNEGQDRQENAAEILENSITNLQKAAHFVNEISEGNYEVQWERLDEHNTSLNQDNLAGRLILMREQMKKVKEEDRKRLWATEGLSAFSEIIRNNQHNLEELTFQALLFLVKYLEAQQGSLFILQEEENQEPYINLAACYAFDRKKFMAKRIAIGEGMLGQTYLEGETVLLTEVPQAYTSIRSGLGDATPSCIVIVPMKYNEKVQALIELASFKVLEPYQISFLEKAGEFMASAIATAINNEKNQLLLQELQSSTDQLRAQEEELRQNMEELEATQEEMSRKERELEKQLQEVKK
jgi:CHASE3 domain sensor protein